MMNQPFLKCSLPFRGFRSIDVQTYLEDVAQDRHVAEYSIQDEAHSMIDSSTGDGVSAAGKRFGINVEEALIIFCMSSDRSRFASEGYLWHEHPAGFCTLKAIDRIDKFVPDADHFDEPASFPYLWRTIFSWASQMSRTLGVGLQIAEHPSTVPDPRNCETNVA